MAAYGSAALFLPRFSGGGGAVLFHERLDFCLETLEGFSDPVPARCVVSEIFIVVRSQGSLLQQLSIF